MTLVKRKRYWKNTTVFISFLVFFYIWLLWGCKSTSEPVVPDNQALVYIFSSSATAVGGFSIGRYNEKFFYSLEAQTYNYYLFSPGQIMLMRGTLPTYEKVFEVKAGKKYYIYFNNQANEFQVVTDENEIKKLLRGYKQQGEDIDPDAHKELVLGDEDKTLFDYAASVLDKNLLTLLLIKGIPYNEEAIPGIMDETLNNGNQVLYSYLESRGFTISEPEIETGFAGKPDRSDAVIDELEEDKPLYFEPDRYYSDDSSFSIKYPDNWHTSETEIAEGAKGLKASRLTERKKIEFRAVNPVTEPDILALISVSTLDLDEMGFGNEMDPVNEMAPDMTADAEPHMEVTETFDLTSDVVLSDATSDAVKTDDTVDSHDSDRTSLSLLDRAFLHNIEQIKEEVFGYEEYERGDVTLAERDFKWVLYTDQMILIKKYYFIKKNKLYIIKCSALPEEFTQFEEHFSGMVGSLRFE